MFERKPRPTVRTSRTQAPSENKQPGRLLLALFLLLLALGAVVVRDREFWFGSDQSSLYADATESQVTPAAPKVLSTVNQTPSAPAPTATRKKSPAAKNSAEPKPADQPVVATNRTVLPPLDVEVVAGDSHKKLHPGSNAAKVEITNPGSAAPTQSAAGLEAATSAAEREKINGATQPQPAYPLLAQHMNVQGSVILQALIGADGIIQNLRVLSGPAILSSAAQQAVREWHFKPVVQNGQPVETKAKITVNFTIKVADNSAKTTLAESRSDRIEVLSR
jgi:TonB family protein